MGISNLSCICLNDGVATPRTFEQRKADALVAFAEPEADAWVATASADGVPHLVPLSIGWTGERIVLVTESRSLTARNLLASGQARLALGGSRDVVSVSAELVADYAMADAPAPLLGAFSSQ